MDHNPFVTDTLPVGREKGGLPMYKLLGEDRIGEENTTLEGRKVRIVCYFSSMDIRVEFEDGTQVKTTYLNFRQGNIHYPLRMKRLAEERRTKDGDTVRIVAYRSSTDIDVLFDNGEILQHTTYQKFRTGSLHKPSQRGAGPPGIDRTGEEQVMPDGRRFKITAYRSDYDLDVLTSAGDTLRHVRYVDFKKGFPAKGKRGRRWKDRTGERRTMASGEEAVVTASRECGRIDIQFDNGIIRKNVLYSSFYKGTLSSSPRKKNMYERRIGEKRLTPEGLLAVCTDYKTSIDIRVEREDGKVWEHTTYTYFTHQIAPTPVDESTPDEKPRPPGTKHEGERSVSRSGKEMELIRYVNSFHVIVRFLEDGVETTTSYQAFQTGLVRHPDDKRLEGRTALSREGEKIRILTYRDRTDMDVIFEDGTIAEHVTLAAFSRHRIIKPGKSAKELQEKRSQKRTDRIGESVTTIHDEKAVIVDYQDSSDVTIRFENGILRRHVPYNRFRDGLIAPSTKNSERIERLGEKRTMQSGEWAKIIAYRTAADIDVRFADGTIRTHVTYHAFKRGMVARKNRFAETRIGEQRPNKDGLILTCTDYRSVYDIDVQFPDGTSLTGMTYGAFKRGLICHPGITKSKGAGKKKSGTKN